MPTLAGRFPIRFTGVNRAMVVLGIRRSTSYVAVGGNGGHLVVKMGWAFTLDAPLTTVRSASPDASRVLGWGVHGWRGEWLVNGSSSGIVRVELDPPAPARLLHTFPLRVRVLRVAVDDPDGLLEALAPG